QLAAVSNSMAVIDNTGNFYNCIAAIFPSPFHVEWYNGTAYQDTGVATALNAWYKLNENFSFKNNAGSISVNNVVAASNQTRYDASATYPKIVQFTAHSPTTGGSANTMWTDDVQAIQYMASIPTFSAGSEQNSSPGSPTNLTATAGNAQVALNWT